MLRCEGGYVYTGITVNIRRRMEEHFCKNSKCAKYTLAHPAKKLEAVWQSDDRILASKLEYYIKKLSKKQKEALINDNNMEQLLGEKIPVEKYTRVELREQL